MDTRSPDAANTTLSRHSTVNSSTATPTPPKTEHPFLEIVRFLLIAIIIVAPIRLFVAQPFVVSGASMEETFQSGDYLIVDQLSYYFETPARGDVIVFKYPLDPSKYFIKRIVGVPGDTLTISNGAVRIENATTPNGGKVLTEPYIHAARTAGNIDRVLGETEYFVMGDNRDESSDSRIWGTVQQEEIVGRAFLRLFPPHELELLPGAYPTDSIDTATREISSKRTPTVTTVPIITPA